MRNLKDLKEGELISISSIEVLNKLLKKAEKEGVDSLVLKHIKYDIPERVDKIYVDVFSNKYYYKVCIDEEVKTIDINEFLK